MHKKLQQPQDCNGMLGYTQHPEREENINHYKKKKTLGEVVKGNAHSRCSVSESRRRNTKQPLWFDRPYMLMLGRPNSCCGSHEIPPHPSPAPPPSQLPTLSERVITKRWSIKCRYFPVRQDRPGPPLCSTASATAPVLAQQAELRPLTSKMLSHSSLSPLFLRAPFAKISLPASELLLKCWSVTKRLTTIKHNPAPCWARV